MPSHHPCGTVIFLLQPLMICVSQTLMFIRSSLWLLSLDRTTSFASRYCQPASAMWSRIQLRPVDQTSHSFACILSRPVGR
ncbi:hypothetical protein B0O80DRAFT_475428 [Mortierella sp. GBAus27b]|nr:hypothetical protein B0O80DRAFT_475428 [Mortierella sp. GBAus27b]